MRRAVTALGSWWFAPAPAIRLGILRAIVGAAGTAWVLAVAIEQLMKPYRVTFTPRGVVALITAEPYPTAVIVATMIVGGALGVAFATGWRYRLTGPLFAVAALVVISYRNSWTGAHHTDNLVLVHIVVLALAPAATAFSLDARAKGAEAPASWRFGWPIRLMASLTVGSYVLAGWAKLATSGIEWVTSDIVQVHAAARAYESSLLGVPVSPLPEILGAAPWLFNFAAAATVIVELIAPAALFGGRIRTAWVIAAIGLHWGVLAMFYLVFPYQMLGLAMLPLFEVERLLPGRRRVVAAAPG